MQQKYETRSFYVLWTPDKNFSSINLIRYNQIFPLEQQYGLFLYGDEKNNDTQTGTSAAVILGEDAGVTLK